MHDSNKGFAQAVQSAVGERAGYLDDLGHMLIPGNRRHPSEEVIAACRQALYDIIIQIEKSILTGAGKDMSGPPRAMTLHALAESGALHDIGLIDALFQQYQLWRLIHADRDSVHPDGGAMTQSHVNLLEQDPDPLIRETVQQLKQAELRYSEHIQGHMSELPLPVLHRLCWRIVDYLDSYFETEPEIRQEIPRAATLWLSHRHEAESLLNIAGKLAFLLRTQGGVEEQAWLLDPAKAGVAVFMAALAMNAGCEPSLFLEAIADPTVPRLTLLLRSAGIGQIQAASVFGYFAQGHFASGDIVRAIDHYENVTKQDAQTALTLWKEARRRQAGFFHDEADEP